MSQFDPNSVSINYTLNFSQVSLLLEGLAELPIKRAGEFHNAFRGVALQQIAAAEEAHRKENGPADPAPAETQDEAQPD